MICMHSLVACDHAQKYIPASRANGSRFLKSQIASGRDLRALSVGLGLHLDQPRAPARDQGLCLLPCALIPLPLLRCQCPLATVVWLPNHAEFPSIS
jgi:hypothetical protein